MIALLLVWSGWCGATERGAVKTNLEAEWIKAREAGGYPAALGLAPERLKPFSVGVPPRFWTDEWTSRADDLTRELYVSLVLARADFARAAHLESRRALSTLGLLNVLAQSACQQQPEDCHRVLEAIVRHAVRTALSEVPARTAEEAACLRPVLTYLSERGQSNRALGLATSAARARWAKSEHARGDRAMQSILGVGLLAGLDWTLATVVGPYRGFVHALLWGGAPFVPALLDGDFPFTSQFDWSRNHVSLVIKDCEGLLGDAQ